METLVLSHAYLPVDKIGWRRAVTLWALEKVEVLEEYEDREVRATSLTLRMPAVVRFVHRVATRVQGVKLSRDNLFARDEGRCQYCGRPLTRSTATWDHVVPRCQGGRTTWQNIVLACVGCNQQKGGRTPLEAGLRLRAAPVAPRSVSAVLRVSIADPRRVPVPWRQYLRDLTYWHSDLEEVE